MTNQLIPIKLQYTYNGYLVEIDNQGDGGFWWCVRKFNDHHKLLHRQFAYCKSLEEAQTAAVDDINAHIYHTEAALDSQGEEQ